MYFVVPCVGTILMEKLSWMHESALHGQREVGERVAQSVKSLLVKANAIC